MLRKVRVIILSLALLLVSGILLTGVEVVWTPPYRLASGIEADTIFEGWSIKAAAEAYIYPYQGKIFVGEAIVGGITSAQAVRKPAYITFHNLPTGDYSFEADVKVYTLSFSIKQGVPIAEAITATMTPSEIRVVIGGRGCGFPSP